MKGSYDAHIKLPQVVPTKKPKRLSLVYRSGIVLLEFKLLRGSMASTD